MSLKVNNLVCECFFTNNFHIQVKNKSLHIFYVDEVHFREVTISKLSLNLTESEIKHIITELENEKNRRLNVFQLSQEHKKVINEKYIPKLKHVYTLKESYLDKRFLETVVLCKNSSIPDSDVLKAVHLIEGTTDIYRVPIFTDQFCSDFLNELENFESSDLPRGRPNSMNHYGILLDEIGFYENFIDPLRENYLNPICRRLFKDLLGNPDHIQNKPHDINSVHKNNQFLTMDSQKAFIVNYKIGKDVDLDSHYDNSEITFNISLNGNQCADGNCDVIRSNKSNFEDGEVYFEIKGKKTEISYVSVPHIKGSTIIHKGSVVHGAHPILDGHRTNLIIWARSSGVRNKMCPMCKREPKLKTISGIGDGFTDREQGCD